MGHSRRGRASSKSGNVPMPPEREKIQSTSKTATGHCGSVALRGDSSAIVESLVDVMSAFEKWAIAAE
jgi:hypothetical protein